MQEEKKPVGGLKSEATDAALPGQAVKEATAKTSETIKEEVHQYRRERILTRAAELFSQKGFRGASVNDLATMLGVTKPFIYYYVKNKQDILEQICNATIDMPHQLFDEILAEKLPPIETLYKFVVHFTLVQGQNQEYVSVFFREEPNISDDLRDYVNTRRREFDSRLEEILNAGVAAGDFRIPDVPVTAKALAGMICWVFTWYRPDRRLTLREISEIFADLALKMVDARRSPEFSADALYNRS